MGFFLPFFLSRALLYCMLLYSVLENLELKPLAQEKTKQKLHVMHGFLEGGEWDSLLFVIIINNDKANSEKIKTWSSELFAGFTLTLVLNFHALVTHTSLKECGERKMSLQSL